MSLSLTLFDKAACQLQLRLQFGSRDCVRGLRNKNGKVWTRFQELINLKVLKEKEKKKKVDRWNSAIKTVVDLNDDIVLYQEGSVVVTALTVALSLYYLHGHSYVACASLIHAMIMGAVWQSCSLLQKVNNKLVTTKDLNSNDPKKIEKDVEETFKELQKTSCLFFLRLHKTKDPEYSLNTFKELLERLHLGHPDQVNLQQWVHLGWAMGSFYFTLFAFKERAYLMAVAAIVHTMIAERSWEVCRTSYLALTDKSSQEDKKGELITLLALLSPSLATAKAAHNYIVVPTSFVYSLCRVMLFAKT